VFLERFLLFERFSCWNPCYHGFSEFSGGVICLFFGVVFEVTVERFTAVVYARNPCSVIRLYCFVSALLGFLSLGDSLTHGLL
jgi:hypothetical protein